MKKRLALGGLVALLFVGAALATGSLFPNPERAQAEDGTEQLAAGGSHACMITAGGWVLCWGNNEWGQIGNGLTGGYVTVATPTGLTGAVQIEGGGFHTCAVLANGTLKCWGMNVLGQLGDGTTTDRPSPVLVPGLSGVRAVSAGTYHTCALLANGTAKCWGHNPYGELGDGTTTGRSSPVTVTGLVGGSAISAGEFGTCALLATGRGSCWGNNARGQLGIGVSDTSPHPSPVPIPGLSGLRKLTLGGYGVCALHSAGVSCWGWNVTGAVGDGTTTDRHSPTLVLPGSGVLDISGGGLHTCAALTSAVRCWGANNSGQLGNGSTVGPESCTGLNWACSTTPITVVGVGGSSVLGGIQHLAAGAEFTCGYGTTRSGVCWGRNSGGTGQLGDGTIIDRPYPVEVLNSFDGPVPGFSGVALPFLISPATDLGLSPARLTAGKDHTCLVTAANITKCWGMNFYGQLGDGTNTNRLSPTDNDLTEALMIDGGGFHTCATISGGTIECFGNNADGQLGNGDNTGPESCSGAACSNDPIAVVSLGGDALRVASGERHSCALLHAGTVECWGDNDNGQLGDGTTTDSDMPVNLPLDMNGDTVVDDDDTVGSIASGTNFSCARLTGGDVYCWGDNLYGQLGNGNTTDSLIPVQVGLSGTATSITAGDKHACAVVSGNAFCWGNNSFGQLGDGQSCGVASCSTPQLVETSGAQNVLQIDAGGADFERSHTCAVLVTGDVECWGDNDYGQIGDGSNVDRTLPVAVAGLPADAEHVATGGTHTCVLLVTGAVACWGHNDRGQVGNGTTTNSSTPVTNSQDTDNDGCPDYREAQTGGGSQLSGGMRWIDNPWDYFNPTGDGLNRVDDILATVDAYFQDDNDSSPGNPPFVPGYSRSTDRTLISGQQPWNLGPPNGQQRVDDILNQVKQYFHDCA